MGKFIKENIEEEKGRIVGVLRGETKFILSIVVFIFGIVGPYFSIKSDIALIQKDIEVININHLAHIQDDVNELYQKDKEKADDIAEINKRLERILTILER